MTTNEKQNKQPEAGKKELTPRQIQMRKKMVVFPLFFLAFAGCMWLIFSPGEKEREEPSAGFNTELPTPESEGILSEQSEPDGATGISHPLPECIGRIGNIAAVSAGNIQTGDRFDSA